MNFRKSIKNSDYAVPIAESTHIADSTVSPSPKSKFSWGGKFSPRSNKLSPLPSSNASAVVKANLRPKKLDPQIYRDTQSNGLASRIVKYFEASEAKTRPIANRTYNRPGDFPIVNLDRNGISINPRQTNGPTISKINVAPPIATNNQATARLAIFRTGKNYGETMPIAQSTTSANSVRTATMQLTDTTRENEPIVSTSSDYESNPTRSVLDALKEISRKRIHCDELDGDFVKKQKADKSPNTVARDDYPHMPSNISKRTRDRTSPTYYSSLNEAQKKRYKNNDILSSLSSSLLINNPKRRMEFSPPTARSSIDGQREHKKQILEHPSNNTDYSGIKSRPSIHIEQNEIEIQPINNDAEIIASIDLPKAKEYVPTNQQQKSAATKLTLFNKIYDPANENLTPDRSEQNECDEYDENQMSFVKPKTKTSTVFNVDRTGSKSKLAIMLSYLSGDSKDEVDNSSDKISETASNKNETSASLNTASNTTVTFSTATTTSIINLLTSSSPTSTENVLLSEPKSPSSSAAATVTSSTTDSTKITGISFSLPTKTETSIATNEKETVQLPVVIANLPSVPISTTSTSITTPSELPPRIGGFSFAATSTLQSTPTIAKPLNISFGLNTSPTVSTTIDSASKPALPTFSFGSKPTPTTTVSAPLGTSTGGFTFGTTTTKPTDLNKTIDLTPSQSTPAVNTGTPLTTSTSAISFDSTKSVELPKNAPLIFQSNSKTTVPPLSFGNKIAQTNPGSMPAGAIDSSFYFGATQNAATPSFGAANIPKTTASVETAPATTTPSTGFTFGSANTASNQTLSTVQFGNSISNDKQNNLVPTFGQTKSIATPATGIFGAAIPSTASTGAFSFGSKNSNAPPVTTTATTTTSSQPNTNLFGATTSPPTFGNTFNSSANSAFGGFSANTNTVSAFKATDSTPTFGNTNNQSSSTNLFGSTAPQKTEQTFGSVSNQKNATSGFLAGATKPALSFGHSTAPAFGSSSNNSSTSAFGSGLSHTPAFGSSSNVFGSASNQTQPTIGSNTNLFNTQNSTTTGTFGAAQPSVQPSGGTFSFGQSSVTTTPSNLGLFGSTATNTSTNSPFAFGQNTSTVPQQNGGIFRSQATDSSSPFAFNASGNTINNTSAMTAPPSFGDSTSAFNFSAKPSAFGSQPSVTTDVKPAFSFNANNNASANVPSFGSPPANQSPFGANNAVPVGANSTFTFGANATDTSKSFNFNANPSDNTNNMFGGPTTAPAVVAPFTFSAPGGLGTATPSANAFQFNAQPAAANIFSIGPGNTSNAAKGRPIRQATRRINK